MGSYPSWTTEPDQPHPWSFFRKLLFSASALDHLWTVKQSIVHYFMYALSFPPWQVNCKTPDIRDCQIQFFTSAPSSYSFLSFKPLHLKAYLPLFQKTPAWAQKNVGDFNFYPESSTRYNLGVLLTSCLKTQHFRTGLCALYLCLDPRSSHWYSDINDLIPAAKSPRNTVPTAIACEARDVILFTLEFLSSLLIPLVSPILRLELRIRPSAQLLHEGLKLCYFQVLTILWGSLTFLYF